VEFVLCAYLQKKKIKKETIKRIYEAIIKALETREYNSRELVTSLPYPENGILKVLQLLLDKDIIMLNANKTYKIKHT